MTALSLAAAACGDDDDSDASVAPTETDAAGATTTSAGGGGPSTTGGATTTTEPAAPADLDPAGILKFGAPLIIGPGVHFDPTQIRVTSGMNWLSLVYGTLVTMTPEGEYVPWMAEDVKVVDPQTVRITTRQGVTFTDGTPYDAVAVQTSLMRNRFESATPAIASGIHTGLTAMVSAEVVDPKTVDVHLDKPIASVFIESLTSLPGLVQSPKQIAENPAGIDFTPIGAGPYTLQAFLPDQRIELRKNPDFFDADTWKLAGIDIVHTPNGAPQATGLLSGAIDINLAVPIESVAAVDAGGDLETEILSGRFSPILLCGGKPPFDNKMVRQALSIGIDRVAYNDLVYGGRGEPAYGFYNEDHPSYDPKAKELLAYNAQRAQQLISQSGVGDVSWDIVLAASNNFGRQAEALQAQLQKIGMNTTIKPFENIYDQWIQPQGSGGLFTFITGQPFGGYIHYARSFVKGQSNSFCGNDDPAVMEKVNAAAQLAANDPKAIDLYRQANLLMIDSALTIPVVFEPYAVGWNSSRVGGTPEFSTEFGDPRIHFESIYVKK